MFFHNLDDANNEVARLETVVSGLEAKAIEKDGEISSLKADGEQFGVKSKDFDLKIEELKQKNILNEKNISDLKAELETEKKKTHKKIASSGVPPIRNPKGEAPQAGELKGLAKAIAARIEELEPI